MFKQVKLSNVVKCLLLAILLPAILNACNQSGTGSADKLKLEQIENSISEYQEKLASAKVALGLTTTTVTPPSTSNKPVQPVAPQVPNGCDRAVTASLIISDYFYFNGDHSTSEIDSALAAISTFLARNGFGMEANAVDNASTLEDAIYTYRQIVPMLCQ